MASLTTAANAIGSHRLAFPRSSIVYVLIVDLQGKTWGNATLQVFRKSIALAGFVPVAVRSFYSPGAYLFDKLTNCLRSVVNSPLEGRQQ